jgi:DNA-binding NarL/FixJ family response regulator
VGASKRCARLERKERVNPIEPHTATPAILIVEDHRAVRLALRELMHVAFGLIEVLEAANVPQALELARARPVDAVLMDIKLPGLDGIKGTRKLLELAPATAVVIVSNFDDAFHRHAASRAGARAFVSKRAIGKDLVPVLEALLAESITRAAAATSSARTALGDATAIAPPAALASAGERMPSVT